jgi:hypothetical protein
MVRRSMMHYAGIRSSMLDETVRWLEWALRNPRYVPRIPRVRVDSGVRFSERLKVAFWSTVNRKLAELPEPWEVEDLE